MHSQSSTIRSPLREQEFWPATGPVYGVPESAGETAQPSRFWSRLSLRLSQPERDDDRPVSPVYY